MEGCREQHEWRLDAILAEEQVTNCPTPPVGEPALRQVERPVMQHVAPLAQAPQVGEPVIGGIVVEMRRGQHDTGQTNIRNLDEVGPSRRAAAPVPPCRFSLIKPAPVRQAPDLGHVRPAASLAPTAGAYKSDMSAQRWPVRWVERTELMADGHAG